MWLITCKYKSTTIPCNLSLFLCSKQSTAFNMRYIQSFIASNDTTSLLKNLLERFDSLEREKTLKETRWSVSSSSSEAETSSRHDGEDPNPAPEGMTGRDEHHRSEARRHHSKSKRSYAQRRRAVTSGYEDLSRSRSPQPLQKNRRTLTRADYEASRSHTPPRQKRSRKGKSPARISRRFWADRMSDSEEVMDYTKDENTNIPPEEVHLESA